MLSRRLAVLILAGAALLVSAPAAAAKTVTVKDTGRTATLKVGDRLVVDVAANPSTGYSWKTLARPSFLAKGTSVYTADAPGPLVGGGGRVKITFRALRKGTGTLKLVYRGPSGADPSDRRFTVKVTVR